MMYFREIVQLSSARGIIESPGSFLYPHNPEQLLHIIHAPVIQNELHQNFVTDFFLFFFRNIPEQGAVFPDEGFYFRTVDILAI